MRLTFHHMAMTFLTAVYLTANPPCALLSAADEEVVDTFIAPATKNSPRNSEWGTQASKIISAQLHEVGAAQRTSGSLLGRGGGYHLCQKPFCLVCRG
jgi:hypothetical protein